MRLILLVLLTLLLAPVLLSGLTTAATAREKGHLAASTAGVRTTTVRGGRIAVQELGAGPRTLVLLPGLGTVSPIADFGPLARRLAINNRVVVVEPPGYGLSDGASRPRTSEAEVADVRDALAALDIKPPYVLVPHSLWGLHALEWAHHYPDEVGAIVGIDPTPPNTAFRGRARGSAEPLLTTLGRNRWEVVTDPVRFRGDLHDGMRPEHGYTDADRELADRALVWNLGGASVESQSRHIAENARRHAGQPYPPELPHLAILAADDRAYWDHWVRWHTDPISEPQHQRVVELPGPHYLHTTRASEVASLTEEFLATIR